MFSYRLYIICYNYFSVDFNTPVNIQRSSLMLFLFPVLAKTANGGPEATMTYFGFPRLLLTS